MASQPWWLQAIEVVVLERFLHLLGPSPATSRRLSLAIPFRPSQRRASRLARRPSRASARHHLHRGIVNLPGVHSRLPARNARRFITFRGIWAIYIHSNVRLPIGPLHGCSAPRNFTTGTTTETRTPATTPTSRPSWTCSLALTSARIMNPNHLDFTSRRRKRTWVTCCGRYCREPGRKWRRPNDPATIALQSIGWMEGLTNPASASYDSASFELAIIPKNNSSRSFS